MAGILELGVRLAFSPQDDGRIWQVLSGTTCVGAGAFIRLAGGHDWAGSIC